MFSNSNYFNVNSYLSLKNFKYEIIKLNLVKKDLKF